MNPSMDLSIRRLGHGPLHPYIGPLPPLLSQILFIKVCLKITSVTELVKNTSVTELVSDTSYSRDIPSCVKTLL